jgi:hypothetical protein
MSARSLLFLITTLFVVISAVVLGKQHDNPIQPHENSRKKTDSMLTKEEASYLRNVIYNEGYCTTIRHDLQSARREVALLIKVHELHKKKRLGTIRLLLEIVKCGKPKDSTAAAVTAMALEDDPAYAALFGDGDLDAFDKRIAPDAPTDREVFVAWLENALAKAEKQAEANGSK